VLPWVYLTVAWRLPCAGADRRMDFWPAMELSRRVVTGVGAGLPAAGRVVLPVILMHVATEIRVMTAMLGAMKETFEHLPRWGRRLRSCRG